ncbi:UvrB/UvrC motif-containing protein, partial [Candidatus Omnitrophota bacterium]
RNINGKVIMYADELTESMQEAMQESDRRRKIQVQFNEENEITPATIKKGIRQGIKDEEEAKEAVVEFTGLNEKAFELSFMVSELENQMETAARNLQFEKAIEYRDQLKALQKKTKR